MNYLKDSTSKHGSFAFKHHEDTSIIQLTSKDTIGKECSFFLNMDEWQEFAAFIKTVSKFPLKPAKAKK